MLTGLPDDWQQVRSAINKFRKALHRLGFDSHDCYHVEPNNGAGAHVHMWTWGSPSLTREAVAKAAQRAGCGRVSGVSWRSDFPDDIPRTYGVKAVLDADENAPTAELPSRAAEFLELNGKRLFHASRGFWRSKHGEPLSGVRAAKKAARAMASGDPGPWVPVPATPAEWVF